MIARLALACSLVACGSSEPPGSAHPAPARVAQAPTDPLGDIPTAVRVRPVCGDAHEALLLRLLPASFACSDAARTGYVVARADAGVLLVVAGREPVGASPRVAFVLDGAPIDAMPATTGITPLDRDALFLAAMFAEHHDPDVALDGPDADALLTERASLYSSDWPRVSPDATHAAGIGRELMEGGVLILTRYEVTVSATGAPVVTSQPLYRESPSSMHVPGLYERTAVAPFETVPRPRPLCGDIQEAAIRLRLRTAPSCERAPDAVYVAGRGYQLVGEDYRRVPVDLVIVQWGDPAQNEWQALVGDAVEARFYGDVWGATDEDVLAELMGGMLANRPATAFAVERDAIPSTLDRASRARLSRIEVGLTAGPVLRAVGWSATDEGDVRLERYEVDFWDARSLRFRAWDLELGGGETESTALGPDDPIPTPSGL